LTFAGHSELAKKYTAYADEKVAYLTREPVWLKALSAHSAAAAVNAGFPFQFVPGGPAARDAALATRQDRLSYSPFNQFFILQALAKLGRRADALAAIDDNWGGQLRYGATTFFEVFRPSWNNFSKPNDAPVNNQCGYTSLTHPWSAGVTKWLTNEIAGITPTSPGFRTFLVRPWLNKKSNPWVKTKVPTPTGVIEFAYNIEPNSKNGEGYLIVPKGTSASLQLPSGIGGGFLVFDANGKQRSIGRIGWDGVYLFPSGSLPTGKYTFKISGNYPNFVQNECAETELSYPWDTPFSEDTTTRGNWRGKYGAAGYILYNFDGIKKHKQKLPPFIKKIATGKTANVNFAVQTQDPRACFQTMWFDIHHATTAKKTATKPYKITLYFADLDRQNRRSAIEVFDLKTKQLLAPVFIVRDYAQGKHISFQTDREVRIRINHVRGPNATLSAILFD
jgi:hypothetical protein